MAVQPVLNPFAILNVDGIKMVDADLATMTPEALVERINLQTRTVAEYRERIAVAVEIGKQWIWSRSQSISALYPKIKDDPKKDEILLAAGIKSKQTLSSVLALYRINMACLETGLPLVGSQNQALALRAAAGEKIQAQIAAWKKVLATETGVDTSSREISQMLGDDETEDEAPSPRTQRRRRAPTPGRRLDAAIRKKKKVDFSTPEKRILTMLSTLYKTDSKQFFRLVASSLNT